MSKIKILATSDVHAPKYLNILRSSIESRSGVEKEVDLVLLAGDYVDKGKIQFMKYVVKILEKFRSKPIIGVFGNEDYDTIKPAIKREASFIVWLEDEEYEVSINGLRVKVYGTTGVLDEPTSWQEKNIPGIRRIYEERLEGIRRFASKPRGSSELRILLTHYPPTYKTLVGEPRYAWPQMASSKAESIITRFGGIDFVVHGHAHKSRVLEVFVSKTKIYNVALPARRDVLLTTFEHPSSTGLLRFM